MNELPDDVKSLLEGCKEMMSTEDWDEGRAQELVDFGNDLYKKYCE